MDPTLAAVLALVPAQYATSVATCIAVVTAACTLASGIDAAFPPPAEGSRWVPVRTVIHWLALNRGFARNAVPAGAIPASVAAHAAEVRATAAATALAAGTLVEAAKRQPEAVPSPMPSAAGP